MEVYPAPKHNTTDFLTAKYQVRYSVSIPLEPAGVDFGWLVALGA